jgi:glutaconate CoA-transferase subunit B
VVTNLCILGFDETTRAMRLEALHPGVTVDDVAQNTGFELVIPERLGATEPPRDEELEVLRSLDPERRLL